MDGELMMARSIKARRKKVCDKAKSARKKRENFGRFSAMSPNPMQMKTSIQYGPVKEIEYDYEGKVYKDYVGTEASALLDPSDPVQGTGVGFKSGIYEAYDLVQGHLLNADLGGRAVNANLFPLAHGANMNHGGIEGEVKHMYQRLNSGDSIYYKVKGEITKAHFTGPDDFIKNSRILCSIGISKANHYYLLADELPVSNDTEFQVPWAVEREKRKIDSEPDVHVGDTQIVYEKLVDITYCLAGRKYPGTVGGGVEAYLSPRFPVWGTGVGSKSGIYRTYDLVQGHLLNADLGGRAIAQNLFPVSEELNRHHAGVEAQVKRMYTDFFKPYQKFGYTYYYGPYLFYRVKPRLKKTYFVSAKDFLQNTSICCWFDMPDKRRIFIEFTNPPNPPSQQIPGTVGWEPGGRGGADI